MKISYSASSEFQTCEYKWHMRKIRNVQPDPDAPERGALGYGSAVHAVMERSRWKYVDCWPELVQACCEEHQVHWEKWFYIAACVHSLWKHHAASGLEIVGIEEALETESYVGYIDAVARDAAGRYWIVDLKTSSLLQEVIFARLAHDTQLNLYAGMRKLLEAKYPGISEKFAGVVYRVVQKPRETKSDVKGDWKLGSMRNVACTSCFIPFGRMEESATLHKFEAVAARMQKVAGGLDKPLQNRQSCIAWNTPCEYWSQCHGRTRSECLEDVIIQRDDNKIDPSQIDDEVIVL